LGELRIQKHDLKMKKKGYVGWESKIKTDDDREFNARFLAICKKHEDETGSFFLSYKLNGGCGKNPTTGATVTFHWKGKFVGLYKVFKGI